MRARRHRTTGAGPGTRALACAALGFALSWLPGWKAQAQDAARPSLENERFNIDLVTGPVLAPGRIVGLGGAYTALATGVEGGAWNPAAYASRGHWYTDWFEWDVTLNIVPRMVRNTDFDNNGEPGFTYDDFLFYTVGIGLQFGELGIGALANLQSYDIGDGRALLLELYNYGVGYALADGQLVLGFGLRTASLSIRESMTEAQLFDVAGTMPEAGVLLQPADQPFRLGLAARTPVESSSADALVAAGLTLPRHIHLPWEVQVGAAFQLGQRPLNRKWVNPQDVERELREAMLQRRSQRMHAQYEREQLAQRMQLAQERTPPRVGARSGRRARAPLPEGTPRDPGFWREETRARWDEERELLARIEEQQAAREAAVRALSRQYLLISAELLFVGPTEDGVGLESFLSQQQHVSGRRTTVSVRAGIEGEPLPNWVKMRAGTYFEPSRFEGVPYRVHATVGTDVRLFSWDLFGLIDEFTVRAGASADVAERYLNVGVGLGLWN